MNGGGTIVGARRRRAETGTRVKLNVVLYEPTRGQWAYTITDSHARPIARSVATSAHELGQPWSVIAAALAVVLDVQLAHAGSRVVRDDEQWDIAARIVGGSDELPFRVP